MSIAAAALLSVSLALIPSTVDHSNAVDQQKIERKQIQQQHHDTYVIIYEFYPQGDKNGPTCRVIINETGVTSIVCVDNKSS